MSNYEVIVTKEPTCTVLACRGEIDLLAVQAINDAVDSAFAGLPEELVVDLSEVTFFDSSGLNCLIGIHATAEAAATTVRMRPGPPNVMRVLSIVGLDGLFDQID